VIKAFVIVLAFYHGSPDPKVSVLPRIVSWDDCISLRGDPEATRKIAEVMVPDATPERAEIRCQPLDEKMVRILLQTVR
jgi:hypothetical protein